MNNSQAMNNLHNIKVDMEWFTPYLKCDNPSVSAAEDHVRESIVVEVLPAIAKLLNPENVVHKFDTATTIASKHQAALAGEKDWRSGDGTPTTAWDDSVPPKYMMAEIGRTNIRKEAREEQTPPPVYTVAETPQIDNDSQTQDDRANLSHKSKKRILTHTDDTTRLFSRSPTPSPPPAGSRLKFKKRAKVNWTKQEENLLKQGIKEGLGWQAITNKYLPKRDRSGCYLHWQGMQAKMLPLRRDWTQDEKKSLTQAMKVLSKERKELWSKVAEKYVKGRTWKEIEMQQAHLLVEGEKKRKRIE
ncbi:hypothetical protein BC937DRAFT_90293 [Endogone sp. FLAS-F59071]|nr:hypothetical protein BC937DRAFT_90293 [Endogone sp. FLAS-F59071]|eukprot:RUS17184.1 hypothetical protein BC937DRAFT_90293 [Endogone sp. FLAS-F59071]